MTVNVMLYHVTHCVMESMRDGVSAVAGQQVNADDNVQTYKQLHRNNEN